LIVQGWFSPGQVFVLDEYCARYGVRGCHRHLCYLSDLLDFAEQATMIDPTLIHYSFAFCASHTHGNRSGHRCLPVVLVLYSVTQLINKKIKHHLFFFLCAYLLPFRLFFLLFFTYHLSSGVQWRAHAFQRVPVELSHRKDF